jgi:hypothetical protein
VAFFNGLPSQKKHDEAKFVYLASPDDTIFFLIITYTAYDTCVAHYGLGLIPLLQSALSQLRAL